MDLAQALGITQAALSNYELGKRRLSLLQSWPPDFRQHDFSIAALGRIDGSKSFTMEASMAKLCACDVLNDIASFGMELLGCRGVVESSLIKQIFYDAQLAKSIDGTANVQKMVIASQL